MSLVESQRDRALEVMDKLESFHISRMFTQPVDRNEMPDYDKTVKTPMDLGTIRRKLIDGEYSSIAQWTREDHTSFSTKIQEYLVIITKEMPHLCCSQRC